VRRQRTTRVVLAAGTLYVLGVTLGIPLLALGSGSIDNPDTTTCALTSTAAPGSGSPTIVGSPTLTVGDLTGWWDDTRRRQPSRLAPPIDDVIALYLSEGDAEGVRGDLAFAQAIHETGYFTNTDTARNNLAGIAHYDHADTGRSFPDPLNGVRAHIQLLKKFAAGNDTPLAHTDVAPDATARATRWGELARTWATAPDYWNNLADLYHSTITAAGGDDPDPTTTADQCLAVIAIGPGAPSLTIVRGITVHMSIAASLDALLTAAEADGLTLSGTGYRTTQRQIELRIAHCGSTHYAIHEAPASACSPPTARPGTSMHERGLAIDFDHCTSRATACWRWLDAHAATYGLHNLPSEPWHWSTNGR
jgi:Mannosyl-glycoprotein endo-beta-N-acetylglucosaminidase/D-alanyl-D-alanine carboxypeptidase